MKILKTQPPQYHNFYNLKRLCEKFASDDKALDKYVIHAPEDLQLAYASIISIPDKTRLSTVATLKASLASFADNNLAQVSAITTFDWSITRIRPTCIFVQASVLDDKYLNLYQSILFFRLMNSLMTDTAKDGLPVVLAIDEASSLSLGNFLETILATSRKYKISILLIYQSFAQVERAYGKAGAESIISCCYSKLYMSGQNLSTAQELQQMLGTTTVTDENGAKRVEPLMSAYAIRTMKQNNAILLCGNHPAIIADIKPYYKVSRFKERSKILPTVITPISQITIPQLPL
jgi:type IV secretory pathway TraG/TraD family ATPase VirD4